MKATELLSSQHREVEAMFEAIEEGKGDLQETVEKLADALVAHMAIEQQLFYPTVQSVDKDLILEAFEEHANAEGALKRVIATDVLDPTFKAKVLALKEMIRHHVGEEEKQLFPKVEQALGAHKLEELGKELDVMFTEAMEEGYESTLKKAYVKTTADETNIARQPQPQIKGRPSAPSFA